jgi:predicted nucleic acid-binding protein
VGVEAVATSRIAVVELVGVQRRAFPAGADPLDVDRLLDGMLLIELDATLLHHAARHAGPLRALDAIHLASALDAGVQRMLVYDRRLAAAAEGAGLEVVAPA